MGSMTAHLCPSEGTVGTVGTVDIRDKKQSFRPCSSSAAATTSTLSSFSATAGLFLVSSFLALHLHLGPPLAFAFSTNPLNNNDIRRRSAAATTTRQPSFVSFDPPPYPISFANNINIHINDNRGSSLQAEKNGKPTSTAMESAIFAEWEPVSDLERRIDEGIHYEHWPEYGSNHARQQRKQSNQHQTSNKHSYTEQSIHGIFAGYRSTEEERARLKSAHVSPGGTNESPEYII